MATCRQKNRRTWSWLTEKQTKARTFVELAFNEVGIPIEWEEKGVDDKGIDRNTGKVLAAADPHYFRPIEKEILLGDPSKTKQKLGWTPRYSMEDLSKSIQWL